MFSKNEETFTTIGRNNWTDLLDSAHLQKNCNREGFNIKIKSSIKVRLGILGNNEDDCMSPDSAIGVGFPSDSMSAGNYHFGTRHHAMAYLLVQ